MAVVSDWTRELARRIVEMYVGSDQEETLVSLIREYCPFEQGVAYAPVRDQVDIALQALKNYGADVECGACMEVAFNGATTSIHTCARSESPLLQCINCRNTESPAGAMARAFNHGRCMYCGGYFKVVRA